MASLLLLHTPWPSSFFMSISSGILARVFRDRRGQGCSLQLDARAFVNYDVSLAINMHSEAYLLLRRPR